MENSNRNFTEISIRNNGQENSLTRAGKLFKVMGMPEQDETKIDLKLQSPEL